MKSLITYILLLSITCCSAQRYLPIFAPQTTPGVAPIQTMNYLVLSNLTQGTVLTPTSLANGVATTNWVDSVVFSSNATNNFTVWTNGPSFQTPIQVGGITYLGNEAHSIIMSNGSPYSTAEVALPSYTNLPNLSVNGFFMLSAFSNTAATYDLVVLAATEPTAPYHVENLTLQLNCGLTNFLEFEDASTNGTIKMNYCQFQTNHWMYFSMGMNTTNATEYANIYDASTWATLDSFGMSMLQKDAFVSYFLFGNNEAGYNPGANTFFSGINWTNTPFTPESIPFITSMTLGTLRNDYTGTVGFQFIVSTPVKVSAIGRWVVSGNTQTHVVSIYSGSTTYASVTVPTSGQAAGAFNYVSLSTPVILPAGTYYCESSEVSGGDQWYNFDTTVNTSGTVATFQGASVGGTENKMGYIYVPVNFEYLK